MFITVTYYDKTGARQKEEETHYIKGKKQRSYIALYKGEDQLIEMRENGTILHIGLPHTKVHQLTNGNQEQIETR